MYFFLLLFIYLCVCVPQPKLYIFPVFFGEVWSSHEHHLCLIIFCSPPAQLQTVDLNSTFSDPEAMVSLHHTNQKSSEMYRLIVMHYTRNMFQKSIKPGGIIAYC